MRLGYKQQIIVDASRKEAIPYSFITILYAEKPGKNCPKTEAAIATLIGLNLIEKVRASGLTRYKAITK